MNISYKTPIPVFISQHLEAIAKILGDTNKGLTHSQIVYILQDISVPDVSPDMNKWKRIYNAFVEFQNEYQIGNHVITFITRTMNPASYLDCREKFQERKENLNGVLALCGMEVRDDGKVYPTKRVNTLDEAIDRANQLKAVLKQRKVHEDVLLHCKAEFLQKNYFHAVVEAIKSITTKIRSLSGLSCDGTQLVEEAFSLGKNNQPLLAISTLDTDTLRGEQRGFVSLLNGLYGTIRNPLAHNAKIEWDMNEQDAIDILTMISFFHRKLDKAYRYRT
ncbi:MAG: TIGR02391 family protein [Planctomycetia bacterium]